MTFGQKCDNTRHHLSHAPVCLQAADKQTRGINMSNCMSTVDFSCKGLFVQFAYCKL